MASDDDGKPIAEAVEAYRKADRLDPFGFSGWIGREPHGATRAESGTVRDGVFAEQVVELFGELAQARGDGPWLAVASFVNPHDIAAFGVMCGSDLEVAASRRHGAGDPRSPVAVRLLRRPPGLSGAMEGSGGR